MLYCSTRGEVRGRDFREVSFSGYAPDGGMFMPETLPAVSPETSRSWRGSQYRPSVVEVSSLFVPAQSIPREDSEALVHEALSGFSVPDAVRVARSKDGSSVSELFHGQTLAFKDSAMSCTVHFLNYFSRRDASRAVVSVGTSGDTGGSAIQAAKALPGSDVSVVFPRGRISAVQEKHMTSCSEDNVHVFSADGSSDDIDRPSRRLFADQNSVRTHGSSSLNSVNWCRVMVQIAHFFYAYSQSSDSQGAESPESEVVVPTGGAGNITAAFIATRMGSPSKSVAMVNSNDIIHRTVTSGDFSMATSVTQTSAPAIDIQDPYNMERIFWSSSERDGASVKTMMEEFQRSRRHTSPEKHRRSSSQVSSSGTVSDQGISETMRRCWEENRYSSCPHTAVAVWHHYHSAHEPGINRCYVATASPAKFQAAVEKAGSTFDPPEAVSALDQLPTRYQNSERSPDWCKDWEERSRERIQLVSRTRKEGGACYPQSP